MDGEIGAIILDDVKGGEEETKRERDKEDD